MATKEFTLLSARFNTLRTVFLPAEFSPTGDYDDTIFEQTRAYKVLTHSELEYYFEQIGIRLATEAYSEWEQKHTVNRVLLALTAYYTGVRPAVPELRESNNSKSTLNSRVQVSFSEYRRNVAAENHGIKEKNLLKLFLPVGLDEDELTNDLVVAANNYGAARGAIAHTTRTTQNLTPEDALTAAQDILEEVRLFDNHIEPLLSS